MLICESCKQQFKIYEDFDIHYEKTGHEKFIEVDKNRWDKDEKHIIQAIDDLVKKGFYQYGNDENGNLVIERGPNAHLIDKEKKSST